MRQRTTSATSKSRARQQLETIYGGTLSLGALIASTDQRPARGEQLAQHRPVTARFVLAVTTHREIGGARECCEQIERPAGGRFGLSARNFFRNAAHSRSVFARLPSFSVSTLGARFGYQTSYQFSAT